MPRTIEAIEIQVIPDESADTSYLDQSDPDFSERKAEYERDEFSFVGVRVAAQIRIFSPSNEDPTIGTVSNYVVSSPGLWGIESDSGEDYFRETAEEELSMLFDLLREDGFTDADFKEAGSGQLPITYAY